jgi:chemotaxis regulatin CheY-phosphate phosphatase CheZ
MSRTDLSELLDIAKRINRGEYNIIDDIAIDKNNELYSILKYFFDALETLKEISTAIDGEVSKFSVFNYVLDDIRRLNKETVDKIFSLTEKLNMNIDNIRDIVGLSKKQATDNNHKQLVATLENFKEAALEGQGLCFDIITFLEFQDVVRNKINKLVVMLQEVEKRLSSLLVKIGLDEGSVNLTDLKDDKEKASSQDVVDELLKEFGL